jgi:type II restriction enzyme
MRKPHRQHLTCAEDLVTTYEETRAGFLALALEKNRLATPAVVEARALKAAASVARTPARLADIEGIQAALLAAAGVSEKAARYLLPEDKAEAIQGLIANFLEPAGPAFVEELVFRFLLTRGDALGGTMRNLGGAIAQRELTRNIVAALSLARTSYQRLHANSNVWVPPTQEDADVELHLRGIRWSEAGRNRTLIYNLTVPLVRNNIDFSLLNCQDDDLPIICREPSHYIALGELKGGIDPAGADEHWKTASTALSRIRDAFGSAALSPATFLVGAAIAKKMAQEIWSQLEEGVLSNAANLTKDRQVASLCRWLVSL